MAAYAGTWRILKLVGGGVAVLASHAGMFTVQLEDTFMLKGAGFPSVAGVTVLACGPFAACVFIVFLMAAHTGIGGVFKLIRGCVTLLADNFFMLARECEPCDGVVKMSILPAILGMAGVAFRPKIIPVFVILEVTVDAVGWTGFEFSQGVRAGMALIAGQLGVPTAGSKGGFGVVKILIDAFFAIVTGAAVGRILLRMRSHKDLVDLCVAISAVLGCESFVAIHMAGLANKRRTCRRFFVRSGRKPKQFVGKIIQGYVGQGCCCAVMFRVTFCAIENGLFAEQNSVQFMRIRHLNFDISVTAQTTILCAIGFPGRCVTLLTIVADLRMRANISKYGAGFCT
jgi:hypothetical protein